MIKDIENRNDSKTIGLTEVAILKKHFPSCFSKNGSFDIERFKEAIEEKVDITKEGYELKFLGKGYAKLLVSIDSTTVITPNLLHNKLSENKNSENVYISGDNLDGLQHLLKSYANSVKCIYIDPPYNTGGDGFVYHDSFNFTVEQLQHKLSVDEDEAQRILDLTNRGSASHSAWLLFMYPRLQLAKDLLSNDGVIFISIDDNEQANLRLLCDDVFGEENFLGQFVVNSTPNARDYGHIGKMHEYVFFYGKQNTETVTYELEEKGKRFKFSDELSGFNIHPLYNSNEAFTNENRPNLYYPFYLNPNSVDSDGFYEISLKKNSDWIEIYPPLSNKNGVQFVWRWGTIKSEENINKEIIGYKTNNEEYRIVQKMRHTSKLIRSLLTEKSFSSRRGTAEVEELFKDKIFDFPKPVSLIENLLKVATKDEDIVVDFFSGSGTTAHSILKLNAEEGTKRKFITIQLPEVLHKNNKNQKKTYDFLKSINRPTTLDYVGIERIIRASKKIKEETKADIDYGFKHYILNEPEQNTLDKCETFDKASLIPDGSILEDFGEETVLTTWLNYDGYGLNTNAQEIDLNGYTGYYYDKHLYLINPDFTKENVVALFEKYEAIGDFNPENVILFGYSFNEWSVTEMLEQNLKILNDTEKNLKININVRY